MSRKRIITLLMEVLLVIILLNTFGLALVDGKSMDPTLKQGDIVLFAKSTSIARNDIIIFKKDDKKEKMIKRAVGIPGDEVHSIGQDIYVNDDYVGSGQLSRSYELRAGQYFVLGDNADNSMDSRDEATIGIVVTDEIIGKTLSIISIFN